MNPEKDPVELLKKEFEPKGIKVFPISGATGKGVSELLYYVSTQLDTMDHKTVVFEQEFFPEDELIYEELPYTVDMEDGMYVVEGPKIEKMARLYKPRFGKGICFLPEISERGRNS